MKLVKSKGEFEKLPIEFKNARNKAFETNNYISLKTNPLRGTPKLSFYLAMAPNFDYNYVIVEWMYNEFIIISKAELEKFATNKSLGGIHNKYIQIEFSKIQRHPVNYEIRIYAFKNINSFGKGDIYINNFRNIRTVNDDVITKVINMNINASTYVYNMKTGKVIKPVDNPNI